MALVRSSAGDGVAARAYTARAGVRLGAGVAIIAGRAVRLQQANKVLTLGVAAFVGPKSAEGWQTL